MSSAEYKGQSAAWDQFLIGKRQMLAAYRQAQVHSKHLPVPVHHGHVGEASVREWLETFLPKRFGVTAGYIRGQLVQTPNDYRHFDVIIYDQIESPILWIEANPDKASSGRNRIVPAEHVRAVIEVKATFNRRNVQEAAQKLGELSYLMAKVDADDDPYPTYLPKNAVLGVVFFELRKTDQFDFEAIQACWDVFNLERTVLGPVILSGEGRSDDDTCRLRPAVSEQAQEEARLDEGLLSHWYMSAFVPDNERYLGILLDWSPMRFSDFAFELLALMTGVHRPGFLSSFHGIDFGKFDPRGDSSD